MGVVREVPGGGDVTEDDSGPTCPICGCELERELCGCCDGTGEIDGEALVEEDPLWYTLDDTAPCSECNGNGGWWACPNAGQPGHGT